MKIRIDDGYVEYEFKLLGNSAYYSIRDIVDIITENSTMSATDGEIVTPVIRDLEATNEVLREALDFHARAAKLMHKKKNFLVVACDEPYFGTVYETIRAEEIRKGTWDNVDEQKYLDALQRNGR